MYEISQRFYFDAAHTLRREIEATGSRRVHGHTYHAEVMLGGEPDASTGMVWDLAHVRQALNSVREKLDHHFLDEVPELGIPTLENLCAFIWNQLKPKVPGLISVSVERQGIGDKCSYRPQASGGKRE